MGRPQASVVKRQREQARRERAQAKLERREQRKREKADGVETSDIEEMDPSTDAQDDMD